MQRKINLIEVQRRRTSQTIVNKGWGLIWWYDVYNMVRDELLPTETLWEFTNICLYRQTVASPRHSHNDPPPKSGAACAVSARKKRWQCVVQYLENLEGCRGKRKRPRRL